MGRPKRPEWEHVVSLKDLGRGMYTCKCKYCPHTWDGGPVRIRAHILGLKGFGVAPCLAAPDVAKDICRKLNMGAEAHANMDAQDVCDATITQMDSSSMSTEASAYVSVSGEPSLKRKMSDVKGTLGDAWQTQVRRQATIAVRRFFYGEDIPHWKVRSPFFLQMVKAIGQAGPTYVPPSYYQLRTNELVDEVKCVEKDMLDVREKWKKYGCSIVCDGWSDTRRRPIINFMACSIHGAVFLKAVDTSGEFKSGEFIFEHLKNAILEVGPSNVVQVCMDNASNCIRAGELIEQEWPTIFFTRCTCHCLDLLFEDIGKLEWVAPILEEATKVVTFVMRKHSVLALYRQQSKKELVRPAPTRFAYMFIMLANLLDERCYNGLRKLMVCDQFLRMKVARTQKADEVASIVLRASFWQQCRIIVKICTPILKVLRLADREGATMGLIYELTDRMVEKFDALQGIDNSKLKEVKELCIERWFMLHSPLHAVGFLLHPIWKGKNQDADEEVHDNWMTVLDAYTKGDIDLQGKLLDEYDRYKNDAGTFSRPIAKNEKRMQEGVKWWETFGACTPNLQQLAIRVLSQGTCASPCERNWSTFSLIHTKRRNKLKPSHTEKLVFIHTNLRLICKFKERGYERIETTLDMLNEEKDDDRLIALQELQEAIAEEEPHEGNHGEASCSTTIQGLDFDDEDDEDDAFSDGEFAEFDAEDVAREDV